MGIPCARATSDGPLLRKRSKMTTASDIKNFFQINPPRRLKKSFVFNGFHPSPPSNPELCWRLVIPPSPPPLYTDFIYITVNHSEFRQILLVILSVNLQIHEGFFFLK